jgi:hypothetical protein
VGPRLCFHLLELGAGLHTEVILPFYKDIAVLLVEVFSAWLMFCAHCPGLMEDVLYFFVGCSSASGAWSLLSFRVGLLLGCLDLDQPLLFFAWPASPIDSPIALAVTTYAALAWETQEEMELLLPALVKFWVDAAAAEASS